MNITLNNIYNTLQELHSSLDKKMQVSEEDEKLAENNKYYQVLNYIKRNRKLNALNTVGYKELFSYLDGSYDLETAVSEIKKNTRRFAKRQMTWFRKNTSTVWFDYNTPSKTIIKSIETRQQDTN